MSVAGDTFRTWHEGELVWGATMCEAPGCFAPAAVLADFDVERGRGIPLCLEDADALLERSVAIAETPREFSDALPDPWELRRRDRARRPAPEPEWASPHVDRSPEKWLAEQHGTDTSEPDWDIPF